MIDVTVEQAERIVEVCSEYGFDDYEVRERYSGRAMYGESVVAIVTPDHDGRGVYIAIGILIGSEELDEEATAWFRRSDAMGMGTVLY